MLIGERPAKILILGEARVIHTQRWSRYFRDRGWTVRALSFPPIPAGAAAESLGWSSIPRALAIPLAVRHVRRLMARFRPDITSALFIPDYGWLAALAGARPLAVSAWGSDVLVSPEKSPLHRRRIRYVVSRADHLFADAEVLGARLEQLGARPDQITIAPLGVSESWLAAGASRRDDNPGTVTVVQSRRLEPLYQVETYIDAAAQLLRPPSPQFRFVVIGEGSRHGALVNRAHRLGLRQGLIFLPWLSEDELQKQFVAADIYVSTASSDGTSVSLLEAMAAGCFPIVTDLPGNREWITDGVNGLLFPVGDVRTLSNQLLRAATDLALRTAARERNRTIIKGRARWEDNMATVEQALAQTIEQFHRP